MFKPTKTGVKKSPNEPLLYRDRRPYWPFGMRDLDVFFDEHDESPQRNNSTWLTAPTCELAAFTYRSEGEEIAKLS